MSIIPVTRLSSSELRLLGNNLARPTKSRFRLGHRRRQQRILSAVNRSLSAVGEEVGRLHRPLAAA
jgi:hypothetical protein